jgi:hypothetical protein
MNPRLKLRYYEDNNWEEFYITEAKDVITKVWENEYKRDDLIIDQETEIEDELFSHFFKKRKVNRKDELEEYLREPSVSYTTDALQWWKVCFIINYK